MHAEAPVAGSLSILVPMHGALLIAHRICREPKLVFIGGGRGGGSHIHQTAECPGPLPYLTLPYLIIVGVGAPPLKID